MSVAGAVLVGEFRLELQLQLQLHLELELEFLASWPQSRRVELSCVRIAINWGGGQKKGWVSGLMLL